MSCVRQALHHGQDGGGMDADDVVEFLRVSTRHCDHQRDLAAAAGLGDDVVSLGQALQ